MIAFSLLHASLAPAQAQDTLSLRIPPMQVFTDPATDPGPASHRSAEAEVDRPVRVVYCPQPSYPKALGDYGFDGSVVLRFVVDTMGFAELYDLVVTEATHIEFVKSARRAVAKCRYDPALKDGHPVRFLVQQRVVFRVQNVEPRTPP